MPKYELEQYAYIYRTYHVEAENEDEAYEMFINGDGEIVEEYESPDWNWDGEIRKVSDE